MPTGDISSCPIRDPSVNAAVAEPTDGRGRCRGSTDNDQLEASPSDVARLLNVIDHRIARR